MSYISVGSESRKIMGQLQMQHMLDLDTYHAHKKATRVFVNGVWIGVHNNAASLMSKLLDARRKGDLENEISIVRDIREREIRIYSDAGRVMRPLFVVDKDTQNLLITPSRVDEMAQDLEDMEATGTAAARKADKDTPWENLIRDGMVEYLDAEEEEVSMIAMTQEDLEHSREAMDMDDRQVKKDLPPELQPDFDPAKRVKIDKFSHTFTHCEIHPSMILGVCASIIPFPDHNQVSGARPEKCALSMLTAPYSP
jgi:DNA-directed RNA polymerase II subunit RPB2